MKSLFVIFLFLILIPSSHSITDESIIKNNVGWVEKLGDKIYFDAEVTNQNNVTKKLGQFISKDKPTVFVLSYYSCPKMCTFLLDGTLEVVNSNDKIRPGRDYNLVTLSFDTVDNHLSSKGKEARYNKNLNSDNEQWSFYSADSKNIRLITDSVGFKFVPDGDEFAHPAGIIFLTKEGKISRYLSGVLFDPKDFKLALLEASDGVIGESTLKDKVLLYCYGFDPVGKKYAIKALNVVKLSGGITLILVVIFMIFMWLKRDNNKEGRN
ncbi:hypothetical protein CL651_000130 [bacterium]|nr:hypothetical protein [bacterium]|tara:strand:- start:12633 stop:13433 length:801 start_codon:yes stop_codon:yes gene_type:complete